MKSKTGKIVLNSLWILLDIPGFLYAFLIGAGIFIAGRIVNVKRWQIIGGLYFAIMTVIELLAKRELKMAEGVFTNLYINLHIVGYFYSFIVLALFIVKLSKQLKAKNDIQNSIKAGEEVKYESALKQYKDSNIMNSDRDGSKLEETTSPNKVVNLHKENVENKGTDSAAESPKEKKGRILDI